MREGFILGYRQTIDLIASNIKKTIWRELSGWVLTYLALLNTSADMGRLPESSARKTEATNTERVEMESRTTGTVKRWEVEEEKLREHLQFFNN